MSEFLEFQSLVQFRIPVKEDGSLGEPQILKKFTTAIKGTQHKKVQKKTREITIEQTGEVEYL